MIGNRQSPVIGGNRERGNIAKNTQKSEKLVPPDIDRERVNSKPLIVTGNSNGNSPTVQFKETGSPNCAKCPLNGQPRVAAKLDATTRSTPAAAAGGGDRLRLFPTIRSPQPRRRGLRIGGE